MFVSVIIPTFNKAPLVSELVQTLLDKQSHRDFEIIVVDDGSTDGTVRKLNAIEGVKVLETGFTNEFGMCKAINLGLAAAKGELTLLFNDDTIPYQSCIERHVLAHQDTNLRHVFVGSRFWSPPYKRTSFVRNKDTRRRAYGKYVQSDRKVGGYPVYRAKLMVSSNVSLSTDLIRRIGGYNEFFQQYTGAIDREFHARLARHKIEVLYLYKAQTFNLRYWDPLYKQTKWLKDDSWRGLVSIETWKNRQSKRSKVLEKKGKANPPKPIEKND